MKECAGRIKLNPGRTSLLVSAHDYRERIAALGEIMTNLNISKDPLSQYTREEICRLEYLVQSGLGINFDLCDFFRIFFSNRNRQYHQICMATRDKLRTNCLGCNKKCAHSFFDSNGKPNVEPEVRPKKIDWDKL